MKYVVWGCGGIGKQVIRMLEGAKRVAAIVESNIELQGTTYCGIPIISFDKFLSHHSNYPVIVTPINFENEIMEQLKLKNIVCAFPFSEERGPIESLLVQLPIGQTLERYKGGSSLEIYGVTLLGFILYELLSENGLDASLVIPNNTEPKIEKYVKETLNLKTMSMENVKKNGEKLLLSTELADEDKDKLRERVCEQYYDLHLHTELFYNPELEQFRNVHKGKRCFIVATGPSLRMDDLETLYKHKEICISVNGIFKAFDKTNWRPDYYVVADPACDIWKDEILKMDVQSKFVSDVIACFNDKAYDNIYKWHLIRKKKNRKFPDFSDDFSRGGCFGYTVVYEGALQLAAYMGFKEIYLLGADCTVGADGKTHHFVDDSCEEQGRLFLEEIMLSYKAAKRYTDANGIKIYNATRGGALEIFERVDFDSLFNV